MDKEYALYLLEKTKKDYDLIADCFAGSRHSIKPEINFFRKYINDRDNVLDLGCGDGRLLQILDNQTINYIGVDFSKNLIEIAKKHYPENKFQLANVLNLPFPDNFFDKVFSLAVFHHIPSQKFRLQFLKEIRRVLKPKGLLILTVWNLLDKKLVKELLIKNSLKKLIGKLKLDFRDILFPWRTGGKIITYRYFHIFSKNSLKKIVSKVPLKIEGCGFFYREERKNSNIYIIAKKT